MKDVEKLSQVGEERNKRYDTIRYYNRTEQKCFFYYDEYDNFHRMNPLLQKVTMYPRYNNRHETRADIYVYVTHAFL